MGTSGVTYCSKWVSVALLDKPAAAGRVLRFLLYHLVELTNANETVVLTAKLAAHWLRREPVEGVSVR
jgi:hypothetical protein